MSEATDPNVVLSTTMKRSPSDTVEVKAHTRRRHSSKFTIPASYGNDDVPITVKAAKMDPASFKLILQKQKDDVQSIKEDQSNNPRNRTNVNAWNHFFGDHPKRRRRKPITREKAKAIRAAKFQRDYLVALHDLSRPMPARFHRGHHH